MKVLIDTNVVLSAALRDRLPERVVLFVATDASCHWLVTARIRDEYTNVLQRPRFALPNDVWQSWSRLIEMRTMLVPEPTSNVQFPRDPKDAPFLACAISTSADYLITGDRDLLEAKLSLRTQIVAVAQFAAKFGLA